MNQRFKDCSQQIVNCQVSQFNQDIKIEFFQRAVPGVSKSPRGSISVFSKKSQRRFQFFIRNTAHKFRFLIHLTYPAEFPIDIREAQNHMNTFLQFLRRKGGNYVWVKEFQSRGAVHFHICIDVWIPKNEIAQRWFNVVGSNDPKHLNAGTRVEAIKNIDHASAYMCAYLKKSTQKIVPEGIENVGRFWGATRALLIAKSVIFFKKVKLGKVKQIYRILGKAYANRLNQIGIKWHWKNKGFIGWSMSKIYDRLAPQINMRGEKWSQVYQGNF